MITIGDYKLDTSDPLVLAALADPGLEPESLRYKLATHRAVLGLAETRKQATGVFRYAVWRRMRLGWAGLWARSAA